MFFAQAAFPRPQKSTLFILLGKNALVRGSLLRVALNCRFPHVLPFESVCTVRRLRQTLYHRQSFRFWLLCIPSFGSGFVPSYSAAKRVLVQLTKSMAIELALFNIQVNAIAPGWPETDMTAPVKTMPDLYQEIIARTPAGRWGHPDECVGAAVFLASRASDFVTGATICVDGGYSIR